MPKHILWLVIVIVLAALGWALWPQVGEELGLIGKSEGVVCTMDAMQCPDGTWVGRTGPNCEFVC